MKTKKMDVQKLVETGVLLGLGFVLSFIKFVPLPQGGSVTLCSMLPLVFIGYKYGPRWGGFSGLVFGFLQMISDFAPPPVQSAGVFFLEILLDYALAWTMVGLISGWMGQLFKKPQTAIAAGAIVGIFGRYICSVLSGILIWGAYAPAGQNVAIYSIVYNGTWAFPEMILTAILGCSLVSFKAIQKLLMPTKRVAK